jgi:hypothetical protein
MVTTKGELPGKKIDEGDDGDEVDEGDEVKEKERRREMNNARSRKRNKTAKTRKYKRLWKQNNKERKVRAARKSKIIIKSLLKVPGSCMNLAICIAKILLVADWCSSNGIPFHMDSLSSNGPMGNILRPAVCRLHYGLDVDTAIDGFYRTRFLYGTGSGTGSVGTDPRFLQNKSMTLDMVRLGDMLRQYIKLHEKDFFPGACPMDLEDAFNSVTVLLYMGNDVIKEIKMSTLAYHSDTVYNAKGVFSEENNSQKRNTPVVTVSLGKGRTLFMAKRKVDAQGRWTKVDEKQKVAFVLNNGSVFILHPEDEVVKERDGDNGTKSQYQHGGVKVTRGLSMAIVFRTVTRQAKFHVKDNTMLLGETEKKYLDEPPKMGMKTRRERLDDKYKQELKKKPYLEKQFRDYLEKIGEDLFRGNL